MADMTEILKIEREADALREAKKFQEAVDKLKTLLELDEDFVRAHLALAILYSELGDAETSVKHGEKAVQLEPEDPFNRTALSITYQKAFELTRDPNYIQLAETAKERSHMAR